MRYEKGKRQDFVLRVSELGLSHAAGIAVSADEFVDILAKRTAIYRLTDFWDGVTAPSSADFAAAVGGWGEILKKLRALYDTAIFSELQKKGLRILRPHLESRIDLDCARFPWTPCGYVPYELPNENVFGIFAYEPPLDGGDLVSFHIANSCMPESPFKDMDARKRELSEMILSIKRRTEATRLGCESWLNSFPPFLKLFPDAYPLENTEPPELSPGYGWWGQFMSRDGAFNERNAKILRSTGKFPFIPRKGECALDELLEHLEK